MKALRTKGTAAQRGRARNQRGVSLVELLIAMSIMAVISTMIVMGWSAATRSWAYSRNSAEARDFARLGLSRMTREIRDAEIPSPADYVAGLPSGSAAIVRSEKMWMAFFTTFNRAGSLPNVKPRLVIYYLYSDGQIWRYADLNGDGQNGSEGTWATAIAALALDGGVVDAAGEVVQTTTWEGRQRLVDHVVNWDIPDPNSTPPTSPTPTDLFRYSLWRPSGTTAVLRQESPVENGDDRAAIMGVQIHLLVDLNPAHSPVYIDLMTTAQLRNQRKF